ncbi:unnamed protein product [marine sediment metagenome]|uniref:Uncharacterized protein n=1 Tax=marine sediment metagenome TaxID=412755 RepID=X1L9S0_9ZZZZ
MFMKAIEWKWELSLTGIEISNLTRGELDRRAADIVSNQDSVGAGGTNEASTVPWLRFDVMDECALRDLSERECVSRFDGG